MSFTAFEQAEAGGGVNSSLGTVAEAAARQLGLRIKNESIGLGGSDHSPFLKVGIPVLWIAAALTDEWMRTRYHTPQDDLRQRLDFDAAVLYTKLVFMTGYFSAQAPQRPLWNAGEFFGQKRER